MVHVLEQMLCRMTLGTEKARKRVLSVTRNHPKVTPVVGQPNLFFISHERANYNFC